MSIFAKEYMQGTFVPKHPEKCFNYNGQVPDAKPITFRSSWERRLRPVSQHPAPALQALPAKAC